MGYNIFLKGKAAGEEREFSAAVSEKQYQKLQCAIGDHIKGTAWTKKHPEWEYADFYRAGGLKITRKTEYEVVGGCPPWIGPLPSLEVYANRGARQLARSCWSGKCFPCIWASMANVTIE